MQTVEWVNTGGVYGDMIVPGMTCKVYGSLVQADRVDRVEPSYGWLDLTAVDLVEGRTVHRGVFADRLYETYGVRK